MKKALSIVLVIAFLLGLTGCSSKDKIPSISEASQMKYDELNQALSGKDIQAIRDAWGEPAVSEDNEKVWKLDESMLLVITYSDTGIIESCELICGTLLAPVETVESTETRSLDLKSLEAACAEEFIDPSKVTVLSGEWTYTADPDKFVALATVRYTDKNDEYEVAEIVMVGTFGGKTELFHHLNEHSPYTRENVFREFGAIDDQRFPLK